MFTIPIGSSPNNGPLTLKRHLEMRTDNKDYEFDNVLLTVTDGNATYRFLCYRKYSLNCHAKISEWFSFINIPESLI